MLGQTSTRHQMSDRTRQCGAQASCQMNKQKEHWELQSSALIMQTCAVAFSQILVKSGQEVSMGFSLYAPDPLGILAAVCKSWPANLHLTPFGALQISCNHVSGSRKISPTHYCNHFYIDNSSVYGFCCICLYWKFNLCSSWNFP